jgi:HD-like signal output (HDOD) protein
VNFFVYAPPRDEPIALDSPDDDTIDRYVPILVVAAHKILETTTPSFPLFASQVLEAAQRPDVDLSQLAGYISRDALIATQVLKIANSAHYSRGIPVTELRDAIARLGLSEVASIAAITSVQAMVNPAAQEAFADYPKIWENLWTHSIGCSIGAGWLAAALGSTQVPVAFMGGLLHGIGKMVGIQAMGQLIRSGQIPKLDEKQAAALLDRAYVDIGTYTAELCKYPEGILQICREHQKVPQSGEPYRRERLIVSITSVLDDVVGGVRISDAWLDLGIQCARTLRLDQAYLGALAERVKTARKTASTIMDISRRAA